MDALETSDFAPGRRALWLTLGALIVGAGLGYGLHAPSPIETAAIGCFQPIDGARLACPAQRMVVAGAGASERFGAQTQARRGRLARKPLERIAIGPAHRHRRPASQD